jgi:hypothetical protein
MLIRWDNDLEPKDAMTVIQNIARLVIVILLARFLIRKRRERDVQWLGNEEDQALWKGEGIKGDNLLRTVEQVRRNYGSARQVPPRALSRRKRSLEDAWAAVKQKTYFLWRHDGPTAGQNN